jgi:hypothetical protein
MPHAGTFLADSGFGISSVLGQLSIAQSIDHIGIAIDGSKAGKEDIPFLLTVKEENGEKETHLVHLYVGVLLHEKLDTEEEIARQRKLFQTNWNFFEAKTDRKGLLALDTGKWEEVNPLFDVSGNADAKEILKRITDYITDFSEYADFAIIE